MKTHFFYLTIHFKKRNDEVELYMSLVHEKLPTPQAAGRMLVIDAEWNNYLHAFGAKTARQTESNILLGFGFLDSLQVPDIAERFNRDMLQSSAFVDRRSMFMPEEIRPAYRGIPAEYTLRTLNTISLFWTESGSDRPEDQIHFRGDIGLIDAKQLGVSFLAQRGSDFFPETGDLSHEFVCDNEVYHVMKESHMIPLELVKNGTLVGSPKRIEAYTDVIDRSFRQSYDYFRKKREEPSWIQTNQNIPIFSA